MARIKIRIGDIFSVSTENDKKKYFQYITNDLLQLNSDVIRVFKKEYSIFIEPQLSEIVTNEVDFVAHTMLKVGLKMDLWKIEGNIAYNEKEKTIFRNTNDYGSRPGEQIETSERWYVWKIGDSDFKRVGKLNGENRKSEIGVVINPLSIVHKMKTGEYDFFYPNYD